MAIIGPFKSQWGDYMVTQATLYTEINHAGGQQRQFYIHFETTDMSDTVQIVTNGLWRVNGGEVHRRSNWGNRKCVRKEEARKIWKRYIAKGYSPNIASMRDSDND